MTHNERVLALLSDRQPHSHHEIYGLFVIGHSRIADLRKRGHVIESWRDGDDYMYRLSSPCAGDPSGSLPSPDGGPRSEVVAAAGDPSSASPAQTFLDFAEWYVDTHASPRAAA